MDSREIKDLTISMAVLTIALAILMGFSPVSLLVSAFAVIFCFFTHELAHRSVAKYFGFSARYVAWPFGLLLSLITSFLGFLFAAPGAVYVSPYSERFAFQLRPMTKRENGIISLSGPAANLLTGMAMLFVYNQTGFYLFLWIAKLSFWLAFFNLIPIPPLDGSKVLRWNPVIWLVSLSVAFVLMQVV